MGSESNSIKINDTITFPQQSNIGVFAAFCVRRRCLSITPYYATSKSTLSRHAYNRTDISGHKERTHVYNKNILKEQTKRLMKAVNLVARGSFNLSQRQVHWKMWYSSLCSTSRNTNNIHKNMKTIVDYLEREAGKN
jgi:hypothetical protein